MGLPGRHRVKDRENMGLALPSSKSGQGYLKGRASGMKCLSNSLLSVSVLPEPGRPAKKCTHTGTQAHAAGEGVGKYLGGSRRGGDHQAL